MSGIPAVERGEAGGGAVIVSRWAACSSMARIYDAPRANPKVTPLPSKSPPPKPIILPRLKLKRKTVEASCTIFLRNFDPKGWLIPFAEPHLNSNG